MCEECYCKVPLFQDLVFPEKIYNHKKESYETVLIKDFKHVVVEGENRLYYYLCNYSDKAGFYFYASEYLEITCTDGPEPSDNYENPTFKAQCIFHGEVYWDGLRHLYMGDKATQTENYLYCAEPKTLSLYSNH